MFRPHGDESRISIDPVVGVHCGVVAHLEGQRIEGDIHRVGLIARSLTTKEASTFTPERELRRVPG